MHGFTDTDPLSNEQPLLRRLRPNPYLVPACPYAHTSKMLCGVSLMDPTKGAGVPALFGGVAPLALSAGVGGGARVETQVGFEFFMLFWASSEAAAVLQAETAPAVDDTDRSANGAASRTRGVMKTQTTEWALEGDDEFSQTFVKTDTVSAELQQRVSAVGMRTETTAVVGGVYETTLGEGFIGGTFVPAIVSLSDEDNGTFGPYVGLRSLEDFSTDLMCWGDHMDWHWNRGMCEDTGDPHGLLREPVADTIKNFEVDDNDTRKKIRIDFAPDALDAGLHGRQLLVEGGVSDSTAFPKYTSEAGVKSRVDKGMLVVLQFRIMAPPHTLVFSDST